MAATDVHLVQMRHAPVARGDRDVLELDVHVVFGFEEAAAVGLAGCQLEGYGVALNGGKMLVEGDGDVGERGEG